MLWKPTDGIECYNHRRIYQPIIQSNLKFGAYGFKFVKNTLANYPKYLKRMNMVLEDLINDNTEIKKADTFKGFLRQIDIVHITVLFGLYDVYHLIAKTQHGVCKINPLP